MMYRWLLLILGGGVLALLTAGAWARATLARDGQAAVPAAQIAPGANCNQTSVAFMPLIDMGSGAYQGFPGGLYPGGLNTPPATYLQTGLARAQQVQPRNSNGQPDPNGRLVLLSIGMSNTTQEFSAFKTQADQDPQKNPRLVIVDGAQGGQDAETIRNPNAAFWGIVDQRLSNAGVSPQQVQAVWLKEAIAGVNNPFPTDARRLQDALSDIIAIMRQRYPNLQLIYLSPRTYAGYASTTLNPEPYAYQSGFAIKWLIERNITAGTLAGPWLAWGPYLWTNGTKGRSDGLVWQCADTQADGTHPSASGVQKVVALLLQFFRTDPTTTSWFLR